MTVIPLGNSDDHLARRAATGDQLAFQRLARSMQPVIEAIARSHYIPGADHEDLVQSGLIGLHAAVEAYDGRAVPFRQFASIVIRRRVYTEIKLANAAKHGVLSAAARDDVTAHLALVEPDPVERLGDADIVRAIFAACWTLSDFELRVFELLVVGHSYTEAGRELGAHYKSVDNAWQRAIRKLRSALERDGWELAA